MEQTYSKRGGTSGIGGDLFKIKLTSIILFKLLHDDTIRDYYLATNMAEVGAFGDICFRVDIKGSYRPLYVFMHIRHKDDETSSLNIDVIQSFHDSFEKIKEKFHIRKNIFFKEPLYAADCIFILYTNAKCYSDINNDEMNQIYSSSTLKPNQSNILAKLNEILITGDKVLEGFQANFTYKDLEIVKETILKEEMSMLAQQFVEFINGKRNESMNMMFDIHITRYHLFLAEKVFHISDIKSKENNFETNAENINENESQDSSANTFEQNYNENCRWRELTFRHDFFFTEDKILVLLRKNMYELIIKTHNIEDKFINMSCDDLPTTSTIQFYNDEQKAAVVRDANIRAARNILLSLKLKVPLVFGNVDIIAEGSQTDIEARLDLFTQVLAVICKKAEFVDPFQIVTLDEMAVSLMFPHNFLGNTLGNLLVYDKATTFYKITNSDALLNENARTVYNNLKREVNNLHLYRFNLRGAFLPKSVIDYTKEAVERLSQIKVYDKQCNYKVLDNTLEKIIREFQKNNSPHNQSVNINTAIIYYQNEVQNWWTSLYGGVYLRKSFNIYQHAINRIVEAPQISALQTAFYMNTIKYQGYKFNETATESLKMLQYFRRSIVITNLFMFTTIKVIQYLRNIYKNQYAVLNLECILNLPDNELKTLNTELKNSDKTLIIICESFKNSRRLHIKLNDIALATERKHIAVITDKTFVKTAQQYFTWTDTLSDEYHSLSNLTVESQNDIIRMTKVTFQGREVCLDSLVDYTSVRYIKGEILHQIMYNKTITIGTTDMSNSNYEEIKHFYIDRKVKCNQDIGLLINNTVHNFSRDECDDANVKLVRSFNDIDDDIVLITGPHGIGKSTLLTNLSLEVNAKNIKRWIVRINLLDHSQMFFNWQKHKTKMDTLKTLQFFCQIELKLHHHIINLKENNSIVYLDSCIGDDWATFVLNIFLHFYNERKLLLLFDGFDEICPYYKTIVLELLEVVKNYPQQQKMWITTRTYKDILPDLQQIVNKAHELECFKDIEHMEYLKKHWQVKLVIEQLNDIQLENVTSFIDYINCNGNNEFNRIFYIFYDYLLWHFPYTNKFINHSRETQNNDIDLIKRQHEVETNPLLLHLYANYLVDLICCNQNTDHWQYIIRFSTLTIYEIFIESKLNQYKTNKKVYKPDMIRRFKGRDERTECVNKHKKIAAHAIVFRNLNLEELMCIKPFTKESEYEVIINEIKNGTEKTDFISHVKENNIPVFVYERIAEYFAAEYVCGLFKSKEYELNCKSLLYALVKTVCYDLFAWIDKKRENDAELNCILQDLEHKRSPLLHSFSNIFAAGWTIEHIVRIRNSSLEDYNSECITKYNEDYLKKISELEPNEQKLQITEFQNNLIENMKPNLKKHFTPVLKPCLL